jgi:hypothetical protein
VEQEIDESALPITGAGSAIADLQALARRSGDLSLSSAVRRVSWQLAHTADRLSTSEAAAESLSARFETVIRQRDEAVTALRVSGGGAPAALQARIERQGAEVKRAIEAARDATAERDEMRAAWETLKVENQKLRSELGTLKSAKPGTPTEQPKATKPKVSEAVAAIPPVEPSAEEAAMMAARAQVVAQVDRLTALGKGRTPAQQAQMVALQRQLGEYAPKVKAFKMQRHAKKMALEADVMAREALAAAGLV